jgi:hypothetical protein
MKSTKRAPQSASDTERQIKVFIDKFDPTNQRLIRALRRAVRKRLPSAYEMVYDNYNFFVFGYGPTERPSDAILSLAAQASGVTLCFLYGVGLPDPKKILRGSGNQVRSVRLPSVATLQGPDVDAIIAAAIARARAPFAGGKIQTIIRSISAKQRPRRKTTSPGSR